ncbi:redoxin domain-containing protein [soil metagenome]
MNFQTRLLLVGLTLSVAGFNCASFGAPGASSTQAAGKAAPAALKIDPRCVDILQKLTNTYKSASTMETKVIVDMQLQSSNGDKQKLPAQYAISIAKPNRFSVQLDSSRGGKAVSNGKRSEFYFKPANRYMIDRPLPTMEENFEKHEFRYVTAGLLNFAFLRELMEINPYAAIMKDVRQVQYVGTEKVDGLDCDRLRITRDFVRDIWVTKSNAPMLLKVEPDMTAGLPEKARKAGNKIFLSLMYKDQILGKSMNDGRFDVAHPADAKYVREFFHEEGSQLIGKMAPDVTLPMADGTSIKLSSLRDRLVVLDFWATWCPPCVMSLPIFTKVSAQFKSKGVVFIAVNKGEPIATAKSYLKSNHINATLAADRDGRVSSAFDVEGIPCTVFIGRDGIIKGVHVGIRASGLAEGFTEDLNKFIAGKSLKREG